MLDKRLLSAAQTTRALLSHDTSSCKQQRCAYFRQHLPPSCTFLSATLAASGITFRLLINIIIRSKPYLKQILLLCGLLLHAFAVMSRTHLSIHRLNVIKCWLTLLLLLLLLLPSLIPLSNVIECFVCSSVCLPACVDFNPLNETINYRSRTNFNKHN